MPRLSAEARSSSVWRAGGGEHPRAPKHLSREAKGIWREIVESRPADFFSPGSLHLLEQFCVTMVAQRANMAAVEARPFDDEVVERLARLGALLNATATKLRLSIQSALRTESGKNDEREATPAKAELIGGRRLRVA
jgi:phage terminase small subunit